MCLLANPDEKLLGLLRAASTVADAHGSTVWRSLQRIQRAARHLCVLLTASNENVIALARHESVRVLASRAPYVAALLRPDQF